MVGTKLPSPGWNYLKDGDVRRWYDNLARGSQKTADVAIRNLGLFCTTMKATPRSLLSLPPKSIHDLLLDFVAKEEKRGQAGSSTMTRLKHVKSWLLHNGVKVDRPIKVSGANDTPTLANERTPSQDELHKIFLGASNQSRVACALMAHTGLRPEVLGNYLGMDGLCLKDLPELKIESKSIQWQTIPTLVIVRSELSKAGHRYFSFLGEEGCGYLKDYLEERMRNGESLTPESDLFHPRFESKRFVRTTNVGDSVRKTIRTAGFEWRPYVLRAYFDTQLLLSESKGKVAHDYRVFWMGHKGSMEARYTTNKGRLPKDLIDDMREAYKRCEPFLSTIPTKGTQETQANIAKVMLLGLGYTEEELEGLDLMDPQVFQGLVQQKMVASQPKQKQKVVESTEVSHYLDEGWTAVMALNGHQVVLNPPGQ